MKFGKVDNPEHIDFSLPSDHPDTERVLSTLDKDEPLQFYVGCAKWNKQDLKNFYPRGTKDELAYYATQFNSIELNATFYRKFPAEQFIKWGEKVSDDFKFFPKLAQDISHWKRLNETEELVHTCVDAATALGHKLGTMFLQLHGNFGPKNMDRMEHFVQTWPKQVRLAIEVRHKDWFGPENANAFYALLEAHQLANIIVDTAGRRDMLHMRLTNDEAFIRYVGANADSDYARLDNWVERLKIWIDQGLRKVSFFIHQNVEKESPLLATHFIKILNNELGTNLHIPTISVGSSQSRLGI